MKNITIILILLGSILFNINSAFAQTPNAQISIPDTLCMSSTGMFDFFQIGKPNSSQDRYDLRFSSVFFSQQGAFDPNNFALSSAGNGMFYISSFAGSFFHSGGPYTNDVSVTATLIVTDSQGLADTATKTFIVRRWPDSQGYTFDTRRRPQIRYVCSGDTLFNPQSYHDYPEPATCSSLNVRFSPNGGNVINHDPNQGTFQFEVQGTPNDPINLFIQVDCPACSFAMGSLN